MLAAGSSISLALAACLALGAPVTAVVAEPGFAWLVNQGEGNATLVYGSTETGEDYSFFLSCNNKKKEAEMTVYQDIEGAKVGQPLTIQISVGSAKVALKGKTSTDEMSGFIFGLAKNIAVKPVLAVLKASGPAIVKMGEVTTNLPEKGRAEALAKFAKACKLD